MRENTFSSYGDSPGLVKTIAVLTLINGIVNIFWGLIATVTVTASIILICLVPLAILPTILGIFEIIYAAKLLTTNPPQPVQPSSTIAILEILCILAFNVFSMIVGILSLIFYNDPQVKEYFARLNGLPVPAAPEKPVSPTPPSPPVPAPVMEEEAPAEPIVPEAPVTPEPKQPRKRKVADQKVEEDKPDDKPKSGDSSS